MAPPSPSWQTVRTFPSRLGAWPQEGAAGIATVLTNGSVIAFAWWWPEWPEHQDWVRALGAVLQCLGILGVIWGILETREHFGLPSLGGAFVTWIKRFPPLFIKPITGTAHIVIPSLIGSGNAFFELKIDKGASSEEKIAQLLDAVQQLQRDRNSLHTEIRTVFDKLVDAVNREKREREDETREVRELLKSHATGGLNISLYGAMFLFVGVLLGTLPYSWF